MNLAREELARRISLSTSRKLGTAQNEDNSKSNSITLGNDGSQLEYKVGDYVRATYEDGIDYEAKIISMDDIARTCVLKYIGYENVQEVLICDLVASWGKKARRLQFAKAKLEQDANAEEAVNARAPSSGKAPKKTKTRLNMSSIPPPPPIPPMLTAAQSAEDSEHLSAMLMSWYMSGYYTGVYQGMQMAKSDYKGKK